MALIDRIKKLNDQQIQLFEEVLRCTREEARITSPSVQIATEKERLLVAEKIGRASVYDMIAKDIERRKQEKARVL